jgi:hypothetical protein
MNIGSLTNESHHTYESQYIDCLINELVIINSFGNATHTSTTHPKDLILI